MHQHRTMTWTALAVAAGLGASGCSLVEPETPGPSGAAPTATASPTAASTTASPSSTPSGSPTAAPTGSPASTPTATPTATPTTSPADDLSRPALRQGDSGPFVLALQERLDGLGYWLGTPDGTYGSLTTQAVYALQGAAGLPRDGVAGARVREALDRGVLPEPSRDAVDAGNAVEIDRDRGLLVVVRDGDVDTVLHTSTGTYEEYDYQGRTLLADTPAGTFTVEWAVDGVRDGALGELYRPRYFHPDGIAVHGYGSVPPFPASHGCARVSDAAIDMIWERDLMPLGSTVVVA